MSECVIKKPFVTYGRVSKSNDMPSLTQQHPKDACDVNYILRKYEKTGVIDNAKMGGQYLDCSAIDYHEACNVVLSAESAFSALPSKIRSRFGGDPYKFVEFCSNPANRQEMIDLGLTETGKGDSGSSSSDSDVLQKEIESNETVAKLDV